jgi:MFS family permease
MDTVLASPSPRAARSTVRRVLVAKGVRAFADGFVALLLPVYLLALGFSALQIGIIATATLVGSGAATLAVGFFASRFAHRALLLGATALMAATGLAFASLASFWPLVVVAFVGTLNPSSGDVSVFLPLEHAVLSHAVADERRTSAFARYSVVGTLCAAAGSLAAALPAWLAAHAAVNVGTAIQWMFVAYAGIAGLAALAYRGLPRRGEAVAHPAKAPLVRSKRAVYRLAALFSIDAFGGGLVVQSMIALWLFQRFDLSLATAGTLFFWLGLVTSVSYLAAANIARRIGLVNTMVFTHLPANLCLVAIPFAGDAGTAIALLAVRAALSQMDVPTRTSYVMAIVDPAERPAAASVTTVPRSLAAAVGPSLAGYLLTLSPFGWPLLAAGATKIAYDLALLALFARVHPPEERNAATPTRS